MGEITTSGIGREMNRIHGPRGCFFVLLCEKQVKSPSKGRWGNFPFIAEVVFLFSIQIE